MGGAAGGGGNCSRGSPDSLNLDCIPSLQILHAQGLIKSFLLEQGLGWGGRRRPPTLSARRLGHPGPPAWMARAALLC